MPVTSVRNAGHPRWRGEQDTVHGDSGSPMGSSPLARGAAISCERTHRHATVTRAAYITPPRCRATVPDMSTSYRPLITNLHRSIHDDLRSARTRLHSAIELLEQAKLTAAVDGLRAVEQRLAGLADR